MDKEELLKDIQFYMDKFNEWNINNFQRNSDDMNYMNPYFGYSERDNTNSYNSKGVVSVSFARKVNDITVKVNPRYSSEDAKWIYAFNMTPRQLEGVHALAKRIYNKQLEQMAVWKNNPKLDELLPQIKEWANRCQTAARQTGKPYEITVKSGRRQSDGPQNYYALVIKEGQREWDQIGTIPIRQDELGKLTYNMNSPLSGEWGMDELLLEKMETQLQEAVEQIIGTRIDMTLKAKKGEVTNAYIFNNYKDELYMHCWIDDEDRGCKRLKPEDDKEYRRLSRLHNSHARNHFKDSIVEKYFGTEIAQAKEKSLDKGRSM